MAMNWRVLYARAAAQDASQATLDLQYYTSAGTLRLLGLVINDAPDWRKWMEAQWP